jgi:serine phosphatase RsbU (regulator of sigma subunit)
LGEFGEERLIQVIEHNRHRSLEVISSEVLKALHAWFGDREQHEDTLMLARRTVAAS